MENEADSANLAFGRVTVGMELVTFDRVEGYSIFLWIYDVEAWYGAAKKCSVFHFIRKNGWGYAYFGEIMTDMT